MEGNHFLKIPRRCRSFREGQNRGEEAAKAFPFLSPSRVVVVPWAEVVPIAQVWLRDMGRDGEELLGICTRFSAMRGAICTRRRRDVPHEERESGRPRKGSAQRHLDPYAVVTGNGGVEERW